MDTLTEAPATGRPRQQRSRGSRALAAALSATLLSSGLVGVMASAAHAEETQTVTTPDGATLVAPTEVEFGEEIVISGEGWFANDGESPSVGAVLLDAPAPGAVNTTRDVTNPVTDEVTPDKRLHAIFEAAEDGTWEVSIPFPDQENSDIAEGSWDAETEHLVRVLSGSLGEDDVIRNPAAEFTIVAGEEADVVVIPAEPTAENNIVTIPETQGVLYTVADETVTGTVEIPEDGTVNITAVAEEGYELDPEAEASWSFDYVAPDNGDEDAEEPVRVYNDGAELYAETTDWEYGETLNIRGEHWQTAEGEGSTIAVRLDGDGGPTPVIAPDHPDAADLGVWEIIYADEDGSFDMDLDFPTPYNSDLEEPYQAGDEIDIILLTGSLGDNDIARGGTALTATVTGEVPDLIASDLDYEVDRLPTGVNNGYQLALDEVGRQVYLTDTFWYQSNFEGGEYTALRESSTKLVQFDVESRELVGNHDFTGLTPNDGSGTDADPFDYQANPGVESYSSMRTHFGPYGVAFEPSTGSLITTTARQQSQLDEYGFGGGVVLYSADQGAPTDGDRIWEYQDGTPVLDGPRRISTDSTNQLAFVTNLGEGRFAREANPEARDGYVTVLDTTQRGLDAVVAQVPLPKIDDYAVGALDVEVDETNGVVYVGTIGGGQGSVWSFEISDITLSDPKETSRWESLEQNSGIAALFGYAGDNNRPTFDPVDQRLYVSSFPENTITVFDADPKSSAYGEVLEIIETGATNSVAVDGERGLFYSANLGDREVIVYDTDEFEPQLVLPTSGNAINIGIDPVSRDLWVSNFSNAGIVDVFSIEGDDFDGGPVDPPTPVDPDEPGPSPEPTEPEPTDGATPPTDDEDEEPTPSPTPSDDASTPPSDDEDDDAEEPASAEVSLSIAEVEPGDEVSFEASGFEAGEQITVTLNPTLGSFEADAEGTASGTVTIPEDVEPGEYEFTVTGDDSDISGSATLTVLAADAGPAGDDSDDADDTEQQPGDLAQTGATIGLVGLGALVMLTIGFGVLSMVRRRSSFEA
ncbi:YncE family protein [Nesterenkonia ebinurensis]|uniref:YncE family protein n=1 Tax=Nesterenkonia ebinurensis TaxID=2608252 RepID=UPI00123E2BA4|nr:hypothetical protein [Nesterenkonia ebinurensis]